MADGRGFKSRQLHHTKMAQLFSVGLFIWQILNGDVHLREFPLDYFAIKFVYFCQFLVDIPRFFLSVLSLPLDCSRGYFQ
jgi:hypothetical protein